VLGQPHLILTDMINDSMLLAFMVVVMAPHVLDAAHGLTDWHRVHMSFCKLLQLVKSFAFDYSTSSEDMESNIQPKIIEQAKKEMTQRVEQQMLSVLILFAGKMQLVLLAPGFINLAMGWQRITNQVQLIVLMVSCITVRVLASCSSQLEGKLAESLFILVMVFCLASALAAEDDKLAVLLSCVKTFPVRWWAAVTCKNMRLAFCGSLTASMVHSWKFSTASEEIPRCPTHMFFQLEVVGICLVEKADVERAASDVLSKGFLYRGECSA